MNNLASYCGLVDARISASDKDLPVMFVHLLMCTLCMAILVLKTEGSTLIFKPDISDESEPSWLEPELELKDFQLGSARLVTFFSSARNQKLAETSQNFSSF